MATENVVKTWGPAEWRQELQRLKGVCPAAYSLVVLALVSDCSLEPEVKALLEQALGANYLAVVIVAVRGMHEENPPGVTQSDKDAIMADWSARVNALTDDQKPALPWEVGT